MHRSIIYMNNTQPTYPCKGFDLPTVKEAYEHFAGKLIAECDYGDKCNGHYLHTWDDGKRLLCRCKACGGLVLVQQSEYHGDESDDYYTDYFPVHSKQEAEQLNETYGGWQMEQEWKEKWVATTNGHVSGHNWKEQ